MQQPGPFALLRLPETFKVDDEALEENFRAAIRQVHPDRFAGRSSAERRVAEQWTAALNEAYDTVKSPEKRAAWLCAKRGAAIDAERDTRLSPEFLMEQMSWREALEESGDKEACAALCAKGEAAQAELVAGLEDALDVEGDLERARELTRRLLFIVKFNAEAQAALRRYAQ